jgi:hypothetical protein
VDPCCYRFYRLNYGDVKRPRKQDPEKRIARSNRTKYYFNHSDAYLLTQSFDVPSKHKHVESSLREAYNSGNHGQTHHSRPLPLGLGGCLRRLCIRLGIRRTRQGVAHGRFGGTMLPVAGSPTSRVVLTFSPPPSVAHRLCPCPVVTVAVVD